MPRRRLTLLGSVVICVTACVSFLGGPGTAATNPCAGATPAKWKPWSNWLRGDVTGDGHRDFVFVGQRYPEKPVCRRLLFVETGHRTFFAPILQRDIDWVTESDAPAPAALANIDHVRGAEILVILHHSGDGHELEAIYTVRDGRILRYRIDGYENENAVVEGGSVCCISGFVCVRPAAGLLIASDAGPGGRRSFVVARTFLRERGLRFVLTRKQRRWVKDLSELPEFRSRDTCTVTSARRPDLPRNPKEPQLG